MHEVGEYLRHLSFCEVDEWYIRCVSLEWVGWAEGPRRHLAKQVGSRVSRHQHACDW